MLTRPGGKCQTSRVRRRWRDAASLDHEAADGHRQPEAARPRATRVEPQDALARLGERLVRVAEDHDRRALLRRVEADERAVVEDAAPGTPPRSSSRRSGRSRAHPASTLPRTGMTGRERAELLRGRGFRRCRQRGGSRRSRAAPRPPPGARGRGCPRRPRPSASPPQGLAHPDEVAGAAAGTRRGVGEEQHHRRAEVERADLVASPHARPARRGRHVRPPRPRFVTRSAKARLIRPTFAAPTRTMATGPWASASTKRATRSLRVKRPGIERTPAAFTGKRRPGT